MVMRARDIPNVITVFRFLLVPPVIWLLLQDEFGAAFAVFLLAGVSDGVDGFLAKRYDWSSRLGGLLDPLADKTLLVSCYLTLGWLQLIPYWLVAVIILRDLVILAGAITYHFRIERLDADPSLVSKLNTLLQILLVLVVMFSRGVMSLPPIVELSLVYAVLVATLVSGADYVWTWGRRAVDRSGKGES